MLELRAILTGSLSTVKHEPQFKTRIAQGQMIFDPRSHSGGNLVQVSFRPRIAIYHQPQFISLA
jgi:hypothetical protein